MTGTTTPDTPEDGSVPSSTAHPRGKGRQSRATGEITRARVLRSAVNCILEEGYYQTSSNDIARRAGVTWGALQYQFGRREILLLEVLRASWQELHEHIRSARITGATLEERLESLLELLATHYAHPDHLAELQILLDLSHDPSTSDTAKEAIALHGAELNRLWQPLFEQVLGDAATDQETTRYVFVTARGYLTGNLIASSISPTTDDALQRHMLINGMASAVRQRQKVMRRP
jgi:AcrR family transcriptional regulator